VANILAGRNTPLTLLGVRCVVCDMWCAVCVWKVECGRGCRWSVGAGVGGDHYWWMEVFWCTPSCSQLLTFLLFFIVLDVTATASVVGECRWVEMFVARHTTACPEGVVKPTIRSSTPLHLRGPCISTPRNCSALPPPRHRAMHSSCIDISCSHCPPVTRWDVYIDRQMCGADTAHDTGPLR